MPDPSFPLHFPLLDPAVHDRQGFSCGVPSLDAYLRTQATQDIRRRAAVAYVMTSSEEPGRILGYYTLAAATVRLHDLPASTRKSLARYPDVTASLIGRLAVAADLRGQKLGGRLLKDALLRILAQSEAVGIAVILVDALNDQASAFYQHYGFLPLGEPGRRLFLPVATVAAAL